MNRYAVQAADAVENRATNLEFSVCPQGSIAARVEVVNGRQQSNYPGGDQVIQFNARRKLVVNLRGNPCYLRKC